MLECKVLQTKKIRVLQLLQLQLQFDTLNRSTLVVNYSSKFVTLMARTTSWRPIQYDQLEKKKLFLNCTTQLKLVRVTYVLIKYTSKFGH
jgi:hypothetical protein